LGKKFFLPQITPASAHLRLSPGVLDLDNGGLFISCLDVVLRLIQAQMEGKAICADVEFLNGLKNSKDPIQLNP